MGHHSLIAELEQSAEEGLPPEETRELGPWLLRFASGVFYRANSVRTAAGSVIPHSSSMDWTELISQAEAFYRQRNLPAIFHITPASAPADLDFVLAQRGYGQQRMAEVWSAKSSDAADDDLPPLAAGLREQFDSEFDDAWLQCVFGPDNPKRKTKADFFRRTTARRVYASIRNGEEVVSGCQCVIAMNRAWVFSMQTDVAHRRRGLAKRLLGKLARWAMEQSAMNMHLQVMADNSPALNLYTRSGFTKTYPYHYRVAG